MDPDFAVRLLGGEYTGEDCDVKCMCMAIAPYIQIEDLDAIERILVHGSRA